MNTFTLKMIAVILMTLDHIAYFFPDMPIAFRWLGRCAAPIFVFCLANGMKYTSSAKRYVIRLYIASVIMSVCQYFINIDLNFMRTLFVISILIYILQKCKNSCYNVKKVMFLFCGYQVMVCILCSVGIASSSAETETFFFYILPAITGSILTLEGGSIWVALGIIFYLCLENKKKLSVAYILYIGIYEFLIGTLILPKILYRISVFIPVIGNFISDCTECIFSVIIGIEPYFTGGNPLFEQYQWMMIGSLPLLLAYNGERGRNIKWFFYMFYPLHIIIIYMIKNFIVEF